MKLRGFFRRFGDNYKILSETAYHEAGHVCISYLAGYKVESSRIDGNHPGNGNSTIDFGEDIDVVLALKSLDKTAIPFNSLTTQQKGKSKAICYKVIDSLVAGPTAEARFIALRDGTEIATVIVENSDHDLAANIDRSLYNILNHNQVPGIRHYYREAVQHIGEIMTLSEIWTPVEAVAKTILDAKTFSIDRSKIEKILKNTGFFDYIKQF